jgi:hypothetical protein
LAIVGCKDVKTSFYSSGDFILDEQQQQQKITSSTTKTKAAIIMTTIIMVGGESEDELVLSLTLIESLPVNSLFMVYLGIIK